LDRLLQSGRRPEPASRASRRPAGTVVAARGEGTVPAALDFAGVIERYQRPLLRYAGHIVGQAEDAQDVVQETFLRYYRAVRGRGESAVRSVSTWLFRVAHNLAQDLLRQRQRERKARARIGERPAGEVQGPDGTAAVSKMIRLAACDRAMAELLKLPETQREVLLLKIVQDMTLRDIAEVTGLSFGNVAYRINQGLKEIARRLREDGVI
jgi:RNA polymerase sigma-70 factor (ECF subfamily)